MIKELSKKLNKNPILQSSLAIGFITLLAKILGYFEKIVLAYYFGTGSEVDIYTVVITIILSVFIFFREVIEPGFLNVFLKALYAKDERGAWAVFNRAAHVILLVTVLLSVLVYFFPGQVINMFAPGFRGHKRLVAIQIIQAAFPACIFLSLSALTNITLNGLKRFSLPALGDLVFKIAILLVLVFMFKYKGLGAVIYALITGALLKLLVHLTALYKKISFNNIPFNITYAKEMWRLSWPLLLGVSFSQLSSLVDNLFASYMNEGTISALSYAKKVIELPILIFPYILSVVIFPYFSELAIKKDYTQLSGLLLKSLTWVLLIFIPLSVFFNMFSFPLVSLIFKRGAFDEQSVFITAYPLQIYAYGLLFFAVETILVVFYFANAYTKLPILVGIICVCENILLTYLLINTLGYTGIAMALVISKASKVIILSSLLKKKMHVDIRAILLPAGKFLAASVAVAILFQLIKWQVAGAVFKGTLIQAMYLGLVFIAGAAVYMAALMLMRFDRKLLAA